MKTKICLAIIGIMLSSNLAFADVIISLKDGNVFTWQSYSEINDSYCTNRNGGQICISKSDVISVKEVKNGEKYDINKVPSTKVESTVIPTKKQRERFKTAPTQSIY